MLEALGVEPGVELVYRALLGRPNATSSVLAESMDRPLSDVEAGLSALVASGLAIRSGDEEYVAAHTIGFEALERCVSLGIRR